MRFTWWHRHRWGPWQLHRAVYTSWARGEFEVIVQRRQCLDESCRLTKVRQL